MGDVVISLTRAVGQLADPVVARVLAKTLAVTALAFVALGAGLYVALVELFAWAGWQTGGLAEAAAATLIAIVSAWLLFRIVALAVLQFFADEVVAAVEERHYPAAAREARRLPLAREAANAAKGIARALLVNALALPLALALWFTAIGPAIVFLGANALLLGRELTDMTWLRHAPPGGEKPHPVPRLEQAALGGVIAALMLVPLVNLVAPLIGAAAGTHLAHRRMARHAAGREVAA
jgi:uncharacterized protein involved in cysteine biosynthesis